MTGKIFFAAILASAAAITGFAAPTAMTWTGAGDGVSWEDPANWGQTVNYPNSTSYSAKFTSSASVTLDSDMTIYSMEVAAGAVVTLARAGGDVPKLTLDSGLTWNGALALDGVFIYRKSDLTPGAAASLSLVNGATFECNTLKLLSGQSLSLAGGSLASVNEFHVNSPSTTVTIDNSTLLVRSHFFCGSTTAPGGGRMIFKGATPVLEVRGANFRTSANTAAWTAGFDYDFEIPLGGYAVPPIQATAAQLYASMGGTSHKNRFNVLPASAALTAGTRLETVLVHAPSGIVRNRAEGTSASAAVSFTSMAGAAATSDATAQHLVMTLNPAATEVQTPVAVTNAFFSALTPTASVSRRTVTATYQVTAFANDGTTTRATLEGGTSNDASAFTDGTSAILTAPGKYSNLSWTAPKMTFQTCYFRVRIDQLDLGGEVVATVYSAIFSAATVDSATYTWQPVAGDWNGSVNDRAHWACSADDDDRYDWPSHASSKAIVPAMSVAVISVPSALSSGTWTFGEGCAVTFASATPGGTPALTMAGSTFSKNVRFVLDHAAITLGGSPTFPAGCTAVVTNGSSLATGNPSLTAAGGTVSLSVHGGCTLSAGHIYLGGGNRLVIDDASVTMSGSFYAGSSNPNGTVLFRGANPRLYMSATNQKFGANMSDSVIDLDFLIPAGGYTSTPITGKSGQGNAFGLPLSGNGTIRVNVLDESPAAFADAALTQNLVEWSKGFNTTYLTQGNLPIGTAGASFSAGSTEYSVAFTGGNGRCLVSASPVEAGAPSSGYGVVSGLSAGDSRTFTFPAYTNATAGIACAATGWKVYGYDPAAQDYATFLFDGAGDTCAYTHPTPSRATKLVWELDVAYALKATAGSGGEVSPAFQWVRHGETASVTAVPDATHALRAWTGGGIPDTGAPSPVVAVTVTEPVTLSASFGDAYFVSVSGNDSNNGRSWATAFRTIKAGITACPVGGTVFVGPGTYTATATANTADSVIHALYLDKAVSVISTEGPERTIVDAGTDLARAEAKVCAEGALLAGFSFTNGLNNAKNRASGVEVTAGTISNCAASIRGHWCHQGAVFRFSGTSRGYQLRVAQAMLEESDGSSAVYLADTAYIDGLVITNFTQKGSSASVGYFIWQQGNSVVRNALVAGNQMGNMGSTELKPLICLDGAGVRLEDSTIANNTILAPHGALHVKNSGAVVKGVILWGNTSSVDYDHDLEGGANVLRVSNSCSTEIVLGGRTGNIALDPQFVDAAHGDWHLRRLSRAADMGAVWLRPDLGGASLECAADADSYISVSGEPLAATFTGYVTDGHEIVSATWDFGDGTTSTDWPVATHTYATPGSYTATLSVTDSLGATATRALSSPLIVVPLTCYLREGSAGTYPYDTWEKATDSLGTALAVGSRHIVVTNGTYDIPAPVIGITRPVSVTSVEGPDKTFFRSLGTTTCNHRHFNVGTSDDILIAGFTLLDGYASGYYWTAAIYMSAGTLSNCVVKSTRRVSRSTACSFTGTARAVDCVFDGHGMGWSNDSGTQSGVSIDGSALLDRCEIFAYRIDNNSTSESYDGESPVRIASANAILRNSLVHHCTNGVAANAKHRGSVALLAGRIENCTIVDNTCGGYGGGVWAKGGTIVNSIIYGNTAAAEGADLYSTVPGAQILNTCASDFSTWVAGLGEGCTTKNPNFDAEAPYHLTTLSAACIDKGAALDWCAGAFDLDRQPRVANTGVDMGCYEFSGSLDVPLDGTIDAEASSGRIPFAAVFEASVIGDDTGLSLVWNFGDGTVESGGRSVSHTYSAPGVYTVTASASNAGGETAVLSAAETIVAVPQTCYVSTTGAHVPPFATWADAATNVADAVALNPKTVLVTNGTYAVGSDSIVLSTDTELRSVNGPDVTILDAKGVCRNLWMTGADAVCDGFRLVRGMGYYRQKSIFARVEGGTLSHCILTNGVSTYRDAAIIVRNGGRMVDCVVDTASMSGNADEAHFWGTVVQSGGVIERCVIQRYNYTNQGGGTLTHCAVHVEGTGVFRNCLVKDCIATQGATRDDAYRSAVVVTGSGTVENCTIVNSRGCQAGAGLTISAAASATPVVRNNIIWGSVSTDGSTNADVRDIGSPSAPRVTYSCSPDLPAGEGNVTCDPLFRGAKTRAGESPWALRGNSPLLNAGLLLGWMDGATDLAGAPRVAAGRPAMGCFESVYSGATVLVVQ